MRVHANSIYRFIPVSWDRFDPPIGVQEGILNSGDLVRVVNMNGCPKANTMGHCHVKTLDGRFAGLVHCNSLNAVKKWPNMCK
jgi:hypothetical protein